MPALHYSSATYGEKSSSKSLNVDVKGKIRGVFLYDTFAREVLEYPQALQKVVIDIESFIQDKLSKYSDDDYRHEVGTKKKKKKKRKKKKGKRKKSSDEL